MAKLVHKVSVPAKAADVKAFLDAARERYLSNLKEIKDLIVERKARDRRLGCIYKIYTRGEQQGGDELKHARKVRLKFDEFNLAAGHTVASLYDVPDIVGLTIVVSYPSDINLVAAVLDEMIDRKEIGLASTSPSGAVSTNASKLIHSRHGRPIEWAGYYACHYNVRAKGPVPRPVCEIQIKTVLHDAWGAKTHDLTYKPSGRTDHDLLASFVLLGDMLANVDLQSDTIRRSIERTAAVREAKRSALQLATLQSPAADTLARLPPSADAEALRAIYEQAIAMTPGDGETAESLIDRLLEVFPQHRFEACLLMCLVAAMSGRQDHFQHAQEAFEAWEEDLTDELDRAWARSCAALAAFGAGNASEAIDLAEEAAGYLALINPAERTENDQARLTRMCHSLTSSLAYYHADRVGSDEGMKRNSAVKAREALAASAGYRKALGLPEAGLDSSELEIAAALADDENGRRAFSSLDTEAFVRIQTAAAEAELRAVRGRLELLHKKKPSGLDPMAELLFDFHDYCARMKLAELEAL